MSRDWPIIFVGIHPSIDREIIMKEMLAVREEQDQIAQVEFGLNPTYRNMLLSIKAHKAKERARYRYEVARRS